MLAFEVSVDGGEPIIAGHENWSVLSCTVSATGGDVLNPREPYVHVGGLTSDDANGIAYHFRYERHDLVVGNVLMLRLVETECPDPPLKTYRSDTEVQENPFTEDEIEEMEFSEYLRLKAKYEAIDNGQ